MKCWSTTTSRKKPKPRHSSTLPARMTVKSPSPVIISGLWHAVPAELPPTTAPRAKAAAIASPTGVSRIALVIRAWSPPPKKIPPAAAACSTKSGRAASARFLMSSVTTLGQP